MISYPPSKLKIQMHFYCYLNRIANAESNMLMIRTERLKTYIHTPNSTSLMPPEYQLRLKKNVDLKSESTNGGLIEYFEILNHDSIQAVKHFLVFDLTLHLTALFINNLHSKTIL